MKSESEIRNKLRFLEQYYMENGSENWKIMMKKRIDLLKWVLDDFNFQEDKKWKP